MEGLKKANFLKNTHTFNNKMVKLCNNIKSNYVSVIIKHSGSSEQTNTLQVSLDFSHKNKKGSS